MTLNKARTYLLLRPPPQPLRHLLRIVTRRPPSELLRNLLKGSPIVRVPTPLNALLQSGDLILTRLDEGGDIEGAILEGFGGGLRAEGAGIALSGSMVRLLFLLRVWSECGVDGRLLALL